MNCDQVFDILTRGPFPTGEEWDDWVEQHLSRCRDCRRLAEALQPALELFEESVTPEESRNLPAYWGALLEGVPEESHATTCRAASKKRCTVAPSPSRRLRRSRGWVTAGRLAAAVVLGVLLGAALGQVELIDPDRKTPLARVAPESDDLNTHPTLSAVAGFDILQLTPACLTSRRSETASEAARPADDVAPAEAQIQLAQLTCCTDCHASAVDRIVSNSAVAKIAMSCQLCHKP